MQEDCDSDTVRVMVPPSSDSTTAPGGAHLTVDELAAAAGFTVRTTRYYASLGLVPPPQRRGRLAYYGDRHLAYLELVRALQEHGFTLQAIERYVASVPAEAGVEELAMQRAMLTSWTSQVPEELDRAELDARAGRELSEEDLALQRAMLTSWSPRPPERADLDEVQRRAGRLLSTADLALLESIGVLDRDGDHLVVMPGFAEGVELLGIDIPRASMQAASDAIRRNMEALVTELTDILRDQVLDPYRRADPSREGAERLEQTLPTLRRLTLEAVVTGFQRAANAVITQSLTRSR